MTVLGIKNQTELEALGRLSHLFGALGKISLNVFLHAPSEPKRRRKARRRYDEVEDIEPVDPNSDKALVERSRNGDRNAFRLLVERYQKRIYAVTRGMVRNDEDAFELTQEAFVKAFVNLPGYQGNSSFYTWIYRIAVNLTIDFRRKEWRVQKDEYDDKIGGESVAGAMPVGSSPHRRFQQKEIVRRLDQALGELNEDQRTVVVLREVEGLSYQEIAEVLGCSQGTVMSRLFYARKKLQEQLGDLR